MSAAAATPFLGAQGQVTALPIVQVVQEDSVERELCTRCKRVYQIARDGFAVWNEIEHKSNASGKKLKKMTDDRCLNKNQCLWKIETFLLEKEKEFFRSVLMSAEEVAKSEDIQQRINEGLTFFPRWPDVLLRQLFRINVVLRYSPPSKALVKRITDCFINREPVSCCCFGREQPTVLDRVFLELEDARSLIQNRCGLDCPGNIEDYLLIPSEPHLMLSKHCPIALSQHNRVPF